jgi:hypothetical protein
MQGISRASRLLQRHIGAQRDQECGAASTKMAGFEKNAFVHHLE